MTRILLVVTAAAMLVTAVSGAQGAFPTRIDLPDGFQPEGIATAGQRFYVGSIPTGDVYRGSLRTGQGSLFVDAPAGRQAIGMKVDRGRLFVAGGDTGMAFVYNARTKADITSYQLSTGGSFINDVVVTKRAAWFTDSFKPVLYRVPLSANGRPGTAATVRTVQLTGDYQHVADTFNVNGIDASPNGKTLVIVQSGPGRLFTVTPTGVTRAITLTGGNAMNGDGTLLDGRTLYVVQNQLNQIAKISLAPNLRSGRVVRLITNANTPQNAQFNVPTTIAELGSRLYAVNARFGTPSPSTADYWVTQVRK
jgi:sugar lactone lactonase YvrE